MVKFSFKIHKKRDIIKIILGFIEYNFLNFSKNKDALYVLNYHGINLKFLKNFKFQIEHLKKEFEIINPNEINQIFKNKVNNNKPKLLITFDDCTKNILEAVNILEKKDIKCLFFIIPNFIDSNNKIDFYKKNIRSVINSNIENKKEDFEPISWKDFKILIKKGNSIGSHSLSHKMNKKSSKNLIKEEILKSKIIIETKLGTKVNSFCSINNSLSSINKYAAQIILNNYSYHFTTISGFNNVKNPRSIKRINIEAYWTKYQFLFSIGNIKNFIWTRKRRKIDDLMK